MTFIDSIFLHNLTIPIKGRHLVITGKNGVGKTRFLNTLVKELKMIRIVNLYSGHFT
jgi:ABC-type molybdenum transport system ATPase subunit/photorepair protein PhrA